MKNKSTKASITINVIFIIIISLISMMLLIGLFTTKVPGLSKSIYCKTFFYLHSATFVPESIRQDQSYCKIENNLDVDLINNDENIDETLLAYIIACWDKSSFGTLTKDIVCSEMVFKNMSTTHTITATALNDILDVQHIDVISPSDFVLGDGTSINIYNDKNVIVEYANGIVKLY